MAHHGNESDLSFDPIIAELLASVERSESAAVRADALIRIAQHCELTLLDPDRAFAAMLEAQVEDRRRENLDELLRLAGIAGRWRDLVDHLGSTLPELGPSDRAEVCVHIVDLIHFSVSDAYAQVRARIAGPQLERARSAQRELLRAV